MERVIESVGLTLHSAGGQTKEIPLEIWQVDIICKILGLQVRLPDWDDYVMSSKDNVDEHMEVYYNAIRSIASKNREMQNSDNDKMK